MPSKDIRHLVALGSSLALIIPKGWARYNELEKGDPVEVVVNGEIKIRPLKDDENVR
jgi:bifunctional DNA-binding transcriptional regulator/antitoxin component of YhaV-PrlF toxin-antitoxin module